ncbi:MAG TPA: tryptophan 2,3-dioxygenase family protein [Thermoanaerobaculia bacterium]|nr:tryptophan 2,3-dioxygenase family protein [Thermoanaerobaculia bacterium]
MPLTYAGYLRLDELLSLQRPESGEHDEILFIVIHQVYELWFKELLHELDYLRLSLPERDPAVALATLKRILTILKIAVAQTDVLETMSPLDFFSFRDRLETASGSQSYQFREIEFVLGLKDRSVVEGFPDGSEGRQRLTARLGDPTVWDALARHLDNKGYDVPREVLERDVSEPVEPCAGMQEVLIRVYREDPLGAQICERFVDLDEGLQEWRYRHIKMVERTIGTQRGTGGSSGVHFLKGTLFRPVFPDLWAIRAEL